MLLFILNIVGPVFLLMSAGYVALKFHVLKDNAIDGVMRFAIQIAVPCLLFRATSTIDLASAYSWRLLFAYFGTAIICFGIAIFYTQKVYSRRPGEAVAVSFSTLYSNMLLIGTPIVERAFGPEALVFAFAMVSMNAPICHFVGITVMEGVRADRRSVLDTAAVVINAMFKNSLMIGIVLGFGVNILGVNVPLILTESIDMVKSAALPCALFALGGVLTRYSFSRELSEASALSVISLFMQPVIAYMLCMLLGLDELNRNVVVIMSAMPAGLNAFLFASLYSRGIGTAANAVLLSTAFSMVSISVWLWILVEHS